MLHVHLLLLQQVELLTVVVQLSRVPLRQLLQTLLKRNVTHSVRVVVVGLQTTQSDSARHDMTLGVELAMRRDTTQC